MKISVIIPAYNCAGYIRQTLDCIRTQTLPQKDIEIIMFLDGCTDDTAFTIQQYFKDYSNMNLHVIRAEYQQGVANARNSAVKHAKGEYIHFYDADDVINPDFYKKLYDSAKQVDADVAVASYINERNRHNSVVFDGEFVLSVPQDKINETRVDKCGISSRFIIKRSFWEYNRFSFPMDMIYYSDILTMTKVVYNCNRIVFVPGVTYWYKNRPNSMSAVKKTRKLRWMYYRRARIDTYVFLCQFDVKPTYDKRYNYKWLLFNVFPILTSVADNDMGIEKYKLFGLIPVLKVSNKQKTMGWHI